MVQTGQGDELIRVLSAGIDDQDRLDEAQLALLHKFFEGYPVEEVRRLLTSDRPSAVRAGAWIASELGAKAAPLIEDMAAVLDFADRDATFFAVDVVLVCGTERHGRLIARVVELVDDPEEALRWKALQVLARATSEQLTAGIRHLRSGRLHALTRWLVRSDDSVDPGAVASRLADPDRATRLFAAAAAARAATGHGDPQALAYAASLADQEVASFAAEQLELLAIRRHRPPSAC